MLVCVLNISTDIDILSGYSIKEILQTFSYLTPASDIDIELLGIKFPYKMLRLHVFCVLWFSFYVDLYDICVLCVFMCLHVFGSKWKGKLVRLAKVGWYVNRVLIFHGQLVISYISYPILACLVLLSTVDNRVHLRTIYPIHWNI